MAEKSPAAKTALEPSPTPVPITEVRNFSEQLERIYDAIARRAFEIVERNGKVPGHDPEHCFQAEPVKINLSEAGDSFTVQAAVPGFVAKDLEIRAEPQRLTITGKREIAEKQEKDKWTYQELRSNEILRVIDLPAEVDKEHVSATLKNGLLELKMPKISKATATRVNVHAA